MDKKFQPAKDSEEVCTLWAEQTALQIRFPGLSEAYLLTQGFPNWGTCTASGTFAYLKGYI